MPLLLLRLPQDFDEFLVEIPLHLDKFLLLLHEKSSDQVFKVIECFQLGRVQLNIIQRYVFISQDSKVLFIFLRVINRLNHGLGFSL